MDAATTAVITRDPELLRWVQGCAVGSGGQVVAIAEDDGAPGSWHSHALVLLGADMVAAVRRAGPVRHRCVHLIAGSGATAEVLRAAMEFGVLSVLDPRRDAHRVATLLAAVADPRPPGRLIALTSGSGGAGASTLAAAVALVAAPESTVALVVTDPRAPDPCLLLGADPAPGLRWEDLELSRGRVGPKALREALPRHRGVLVLGFGPGASSASGDTFTGGLESARSAFDLVVVDVAGAESDTRWPEVVTRADRVWNVVRPTVWGLATARARLARIGASAPHRVMARGDGLPSVTVASTLGVERVHRMRDERRLDEWIDIGAGPVPRRRSPVHAAARTVLADAWSASPSAASR